MKRVRDESFIRGEGVTLPVRYKQVLKPRAKDQGFPSLCELHQDPFLYRSKPQPKWLQQLLLQWLAKAARVFANCF